MNIKQSKVKNPHDSRKYAKRVSVSIENPLNDDMVTILDPSDDVIGEQNIQ